MGDEFISADELGSARAFLLELKTDAGRPGDSMKIILSSF